MILDTSAVIAVLNSEERRSEFEAAISGSACKMSSVSLLETSIVLLHRRGESSFAALDAWMEAADVEVVPFSQTQARLARNAYARFGKGLHPAALNFGDCVSYALAIDRDEELLFQGGDFGLTDVRRVQVP